MELWKIYRNSYKNEIFIRLIRDKNGFYKFPDPKFVVGSNFCDVGFDIDEDNNRVVALSASDNLMKGAAGSAIQNMNVMFGYNEMCGAETYSAYTSMIVIKLGGSVVDGLHSSILDDFQSYIKRKKLL